MPEAGSSGIRPLSARRRCVSPAAREGEARKGPGLGGWRVEAER